MVIHGVRGEGTRHSPWWQGDKEIGVDERLRLALPLTLGPAAVMAITVDLTRVCALEAGHLICFKVGFVVDYVSDNR